MISKKFIPFISASMAVHLCGFAAVGMLLPAMSGIAGDPFGDPDRVFVSVISDRDMTAVAPTPAPFDSPAAVESEKAEEKSQPEESPEILAQTIKETPADFNETIAEKLPDSEPRVAEPEKKKEPEKEESSASLPQVASTLHMRRAALGNAMRDFESLLLAAIRQATFFPQEALKERRHGQVMVAFTIDRDRKLARVEVVGTSGCQILDNAAVEIMYKASDKFPSLPGFLDGESISYTLPIRFKEKRATASP
ncbi:energy transducer TonB [Desulfomonile tiedjei]|uniref:TonB family protein n=1 Tax=Desulfomonile tiedjei (strain ATCC 49306 / DSM 6799 / DCB-1) TaxID=706587 RepID=I4C1K6_DESTA|nr:energy transducer TonB [Desulfomonile tiedjei]AFM23447.1 TonB family protein [Desulfomonile tiedjei DSM 6799]